MQKFSTIFGESKRSYTGKKENRIAPIPMNKRDKSSMNNIP